MTGIFGFPVQSGPLCAGLAAVSLRHFNRLNKGEATDSKALELERRNESIVDQGRVNLKLHSGNGSGSDSGIDGSMKNDRSWKGYIRTERGGWVLA